MNAQLYAKLEKAIQKWIDQNCESPEWLESEIIIGEKTPASMAGAAASVFDGICDALEYSIESGIHKT